MAQGRPRKWATAHVSEPIPLGKAGIRITIWDKWGKSHRGVAVVSVGGIRWYPYRKQKAIRISWDAIERGF